MFDNFQRGIECNGDMVLSYSEGLKVLYYNIILYFLVLEIKICSRGSNKRAVILDI